MASVATLVRPTGEMRKIKEEQKEIVNTREQDCAAIQEWLRKQPHLPDEWEPQCIMSFLKACSFSMEKCKRKLDNYFTMRAACPEFFINRDITRPELADLMKRGQGLPMPDLTSDGRRVTIVRGLDKNIDPQQLNDAFTVTTMIGDILLCENREGLVGEVFIFDAAIVSSSHLAKISIAAVKKCLICSQEAYPLRVKQIHVVNASTLVDTAFNMVKPFLKNKIKNRIFTHTDLNTLYEHVPREVLPQEYGGYAGSLDDVHKAWLKKMEDYKDWFKAQESIKANEALRPGKPTNYDELFGIEGTFRQLTID